MKNIYSKSKKGFKWVITGNSVKGGLGFLLLLFLTHTLGPNKLGIISILMVIYGLSETLVQFGISQSIIAREKNTNEELSSIFWTNLGIGVIIFITINGLAGLLADFYNRPDLTFYIRILSFIFLIEPLNLVFRAILERELRFSILEKTNIFRYFTLSIVTVLLVFLGLDVLSYVLGMILAIICSTFIFVYVFLKEKLWFPSLHFAMSEIKEHYSFGFYVTAKSFLNYAGRNFDQLIIGKVLGLETLGIYYFAKRIIEEPTIFFRSSLSKVAFPFFAKLRKNIIKLGKAYFSLTHFLAVFGFFLLGFALVIAPYAIPVFWSSKWETSINLIQLFSVVALINLVSTSFPVAILYLFNKPKFVFFVDVFLVPINLLLIFGAVFVSINAVVLALLLIALLRAIILINKTNKLLLKNVAEYFKNLYLPLQGVTVSVVLSFLILSAINFQKGSMTAFLIAATIYSTLYSILVLVLEREKLQKFKREIFTKIN